MRIVKLADNQNSVALNDGRIIFISYETPVACYVPDKGILKTEKKWSKTTSKWMNVFIETTSRQFDINNIETREQCFFDDLLCNI